MKDTPEISVVMSVYNGAHHLRETIESVLTQEGVSLEFIIVDDGSTDGSAQVLDRYSKLDGRVRVIEQDNTGLTKALIKGCSEARGSLIARQDAGDLSLPGRLSRQLACFRENPDSAFISCGTSYVGPDGEHLYDVTRKTVEGTTRSITLEPDEVDGPSSHPSTLFSRSMYEQVGGYRPQFYFAQDLDLWTRLAEQGRHVAIPDILYRASVTVESISGQYRREQVEMRGIIVESARLRRKGLSEQGTLNRAESIRPFDRKASSGLGRARALYFIGSCLRQRNNPRAVYYFRQALKAYPLHLKSAVRLLGGWRAR